MPARRPRGRIRDWTHCIVRPNQEVPAGSLLEAPCPAEHEQGVLMAGLDLKSDERSPLRIRGQSFHGNRSTEPVAQPVQERREVAESFAGPPTSIQPHDLVSRNRNQVSVPSGDESLCGGAPSPPTAADPVPARRVRMNEHVGIDDVEPGLERSLSEPPLERRTLEPALTRMRVPEIEVPLRVGDAVAIARPLPIETEPRQETPVPLRSSRPDPGAAEVTRDIQLPSPPAEVGDEAETVSVW